MGSLATLLQLVLTATICWAAYDLDKKFSQLDKKLDIIISDLENITATEPELADVPKDESVTTIAPSMPTNDTEEEEELADLTIIRSWITPLEIRREPEENGVKYTIKFKAAGSGILRWTEGYNSRNTELQEISESPDIQELSYTVLYSSSRQLETKFYQPANSSNVANILYLQLTNNEETEELESEVRLPTYEMNRLGILSMRRAKI